MARRPFDFYETPQHYTRALAQVIGAPKGRAYEPCVGDGAIVRAFPSLQWTTNDWNPKRAADTHYNATKAKAWGTLGFQWCITNPPFDAVLPILENALRFHPNVAFLARLSFLEPTFGRTDFWRRYGERATIIFLPRHSFTGDGNSDNQTCIWLIWWAAQLGPGRHYFSKDRGDVA